MKKWGAVALTLVLGACSNAIVPPGVERHPVYRNPPVSRGRPPTAASIPPVRQPTPATPIAPVAPGAASGGASAAMAGLAAGPAMMQLTIDDAQAARALAAFRTSCPSLVTRTDASGLTTGADWQAACDAARGTADGDTRAFFDRWFQPVQVGDGGAYATGYFIPEVHASRDRRAGYEVPIYGRPSNLVDVDLGQFADSLKGKKIRGRVSGTSLVPYYDRTQIDQGAIADTAPVIAWGADQAAVFFLEIQGSGVLRFRDDTTMRVGYDDQNGHDYTGIGKLMLDRGLIGRGEASMQGIVAWLRAHPDQGEQIMEENKSFVFFRPLPGAVVGAMGLPLTAGASIAVDPKFVPMGAPVFLSADRADATGLWIAQDTGGAIRGANRFDTFWGEGDEAASIAGGMAAHGTAFVLLPRTAVDRLGLGGGYGGTTARR